jgi:hypothetical protein
VFIQVLYAILVISTLSVLWAVVAAFLRVRRHMSDKEPQPAPIVETSAPPNTNDTASS